MRNFMLSMWLTLSLLAGGICAASDVVLPEIPAQTDAPTGGPADSRRPVIAALKASDVAALILAIHGESGLASFLSEGRGETSASIAAQIADESGNESEREIAHLWSTLTAADGVARLSAELYPQFQTQIPQLLASAQMAVAGIGAAVAEDQSMTALERSQLIELQWALTGWLARTDFADRKAFEQVLAMAREWILASGAEHPLELLLTTPEQRLKLADDGMRSFKRVFGLYGLDADVILASVRFEEIDRKDTQARLRTSFAVLGVPLVFEEDLAWFDGRWMDAGQAAAMQTTPDPEPLDESTEVMATAAASTE